MTLSNEITRLKVESISKLYKKSKEIVDSITEFYALNEIGEVMKEIYSGMNANSKNKRIFGGNIRIFYKKYDELDRNGINYLQFHWIT